MSPCAKRAVVMHSITDFENVSRLVLGEARRDRKIRIEYICSVSAE